MRCSQPLINWELKAKTSIKKKEILKRTVAQKDKIQPMCGNFIIKFVNIKKFCLDS